MKPLPQDRVSWPDCPCRAKISVQVKANITQRVFHLLHKLTEQNSGNEKAVMVRYNHVALVLTKSTAAVMTTLQRHK